jgi:hypothetical protein
MPGSSLLQITNRGGAHLGERGQLALRQACGPAMKPQQIREAGRGCTVEHGPRHPRGDSRNRANPSTDDNGRRSHAGAVLPADASYGGAYDTAVYEGRFTPSKPHHGTTNHVAAFTPGLWHIHLVDGRRD